MKTRKEHIEEIMHKYNGDLLPALYFDNEDVPYIAYWYDEETDSLMTAFVSVPFLSTTENIDVSFLDNLINELEKKLILYFHENKGIELYYYD